MSRTTSRKRYAFASARNTASGSFSMTRSSVRTAQLVPPPHTSDTVAFDSRITIERDDGRPQTYTVVGEDEADPKAGTISFASPLARALMGKGVGDVAALGEADVEIVGIG